VSVRRAAELPGRGPSLVAAILLIVVVAPPAFTPILVSLFDVDAWRRAAGDFPRLLGLYGRTLALAAAVTAIVVPAAAMLAIALVRFRTPWAKLYIFLAVASAFTPLAIFAGAWQSCIGPYGFIRLASPGMPSVGGWPAVLALHVASSLPWAFAIVAVGVRRVSASLEESALLDAGPLTVVRTVTLPQVRSSLILAGLLAAVPVLTDMTATDLFQVRTLAEEVYTQLAHSEGGERTTTLAVAPLSLITAGLLGVALLRWRDSCLRPVHESRAFPWTPTARLLAASAIIVFVLSLAPLFGLVWQLGLVGGDPETVHWSPSVAGTYLKESVAEVLVHGDSSSAMPLLPRELLRSVLVAVATLAVAVPTAWWWRWAGRKGRWGGVLIVGWIVALPAPVLALGLIELFNSAWMPDWMYVLYDTRLPMCWGQLVRALPIAWVIIAAALEQMDADAFDAGRVGGAGPWGILSRLAIPMLEPTLWLAGIACTALILMELPVAKLLAPPGYEPLSMRVFSLLHQGTANQQAALCLVAVGTSTMLAVAAWFVGRRSD
jgi:iron(III) transport system permease protein